MEFKLDNFSVEEERGVGAYDYVDVIDEIYNFVKNEVSRLLAENGDLTSCNGTPIAIPKSLTSKIDFIEDLTLCVKLVVHDSEERDWGSGMSRTKNNDQLNDVYKLNKAYVVVDLSVNKEGCIYRRTFYNNIYHELNHVYELYNQLSSKDAKDAHANDLNYKLSASLYGTDGSKPAAMHTKYIATDVSRKVQDAMLNIKNLLRQTQPLAGQLLSDFFEELIYRLLSDSELNALVAGVYGDLKALKSKRENFSEDIKKTQVYLIYTTFLKTDMFLDLLNDDELDFIRRVFEAVGINIGNSTNGSQFKERLETFVRYRLNTLIKKAGRAASLYYDTAEDHEDIIQEYMKKPFIGTRLIEGEYIHYDPPMEFYKLDNLKKKLNELLDR